MDPREDVCVMNRDRQEDRLAVCRRDELRRYMKEENVGDKRGTVAYGSRPEDGWGTLSKDKDEHERYTSGLGEKEDEGGSLGRDELNTFRINCKEGELRTPETGEREDDQSTSNACEKEDARSTPKRDDKDKGLNMVGIHGNGDERTTLGTNEREVQWRTSATDEENDSLETHKKEDERDMSSSYENIGEQNISMKTEGHSLDVNAKEAEHDNLNAGIGKDEWYASRRDKNEHGWGAFECVGKEVEWGTLKQHGGKNSNGSLEKVDREVRRTVLGRDEKQGHSFTSRDEEETDSGSPERDDEEDGPNALRRDIEEEGTQVPNGHAIENEFHNVKRDGTEEDKIVPEKEDERDTEETDSDSLGMDDDEDDPNALSKDIEEEGTQVTNGHAVENEFHNLKRDGTEEDKIVREKEDEIRVLEKGDENDLSFSLKEKDDKRASPRNETKVNEQSELPEKTGEQDLSSSVLGAVKVAGEAFQNIYFAGPVVPQSPSLGHRRTQSEIGTPGHRRTNSLQRLKTQMQKAWRGVSNLREDTRPSFNPEVLANQKRQWYQLHSSKALDQMKCKEPTAIFEHFIIVGLHPETNLEAVEEAFRRRKKWEMEMSRYEVADYKILRHRGPQLPILEPQILFRYPPAKKMAMRPKDLAIFCFPGGVKARLLERTPSLSDLNELVYGQEHLGTDDSSFIFSFKVADDATVYGVCVLVSEIVQRPPGVLSTSSPLHSCGGGSRFLVSAPRCYCLLTRVPFFELHFEMLNSMIAQERLKRITEFVSEMSLAASCSTPSVSRPNDHVNGNVDSPGRGPNDWMASAIPVDSVIALTAAAAGFISDDDIAISSQKTVEPGSPDSVVKSNTKETERDGRTGYQFYDDISSEASESRSATPEKMYVGYENGHVSPDIILSDSGIPPIERIESCDSVFSSVRSVLSDEVDDSGLSNSENDFGDDLVMEWAKDNKNDSLQIVCGYHSLAVPSRGNKIVFQPLDHLQAIEYTRPPVSTLGLSEEYLDSCDASEVNARLSAAEEALALSTWTTSTICRVLPLETIMVLLAGLLLEKQVVVVCPNLGVLSATVLSLVPMIRPFQWQSLLLPVLPGRMFDFLEAPVPFLVGIHSKPADWKIKTSNLILVNVLDNQVKTCGLPALPRRRELMAQLSPIHATLAHHSSVARRNPVNKCNEVQTEAARRFLTVMRQYMESLCADLRSHTITSVQSNCDRVSLLLKDSFIDSFPCRDRPFVKLFVDTQLFSVLSDSRLSSFENGHH